MGEWVGGEMEIKANLSQRLVEVEAELDKNPLAVRSWEFQIPNGIW